MDIENLNFETLKSSLLFNFRTGNVALDTLITGLIICMSTYIINIGTKLQNVDYRVLFEKWFGKKSDPKPTKNIINISGKEKDGYRSDTFLALIYRIKKLNCATSDISQLSEIHIYSDSHGYDYDSSDDEEAQVATSPRKNKKCDQCDETFRSQQGLDEHKEEAHSDCGAAAGRKENVDASGEDEEEDEEVINAEEDLNLEKDGEFTPVQKKRQAKKRNRNRKTR